MVKRPTLLRRLARVPGSSLILIVAPPGYGKTTLLSQWAEEEDRAFLRVSLDRSPGSGVASIVTAVVEALEDAGCGDATRRIRRSGRGLERLSAAIRLLGSNLGSFVLALDDAQAIDPGLLRETVACVVQALTGDSALAVASRTEPQLGLGGLRARRELTEIRVPDLAVTPAEAAVLLHSAGLSVDFDVVQDLVGRTEGWPVGLYLAALSIQEQPDLPCALEDFGGEDHRVAEFLRDEVMSDLRPDLAQFAVRTSVLGELAGPVCDAVLKQTESSATLTELAAANPFLRPVDPAHERFVWHPMLRQALAAELRRSVPKLGPQLHRRAADWFRRQGDTESAIDHAVSARDSRRAADLLWSNIVGYLGHGCNQLVEHWLGRFSQADISACPPLALSAAFSHLMAGRLDEARRWSTVAAATRERIDPRRETPSLAAGLSALEAALSQRAADTRRIAARACQVEPKDSPWHPVCLLLQGVGLHLTGQRAQARQCLETAVELASVTAPGVAALGLAQSVMIALEEKEWDQAADLSDRTQRLIERHQLRDRPMSALALAACAASRAHEGRADEAKRDLRTGIDLLAELGDFIPWYGAEARILLAQASLWLADIVGARSLLAEASRLARRTPDAIIFEEWFDAAWSHMDGLAETRLAGPSSLTIAELRVLRFLPSHRSFREIGGQLGVSANTVKTQAHAVYRKLGAASRSEAVAQASAAGLLGQ